MIKKNKKKPDKIIYEFEHVPLHQPLFDIAVELLVMENDYKSLQHDDLLKIAKTPDFTNRALVYYCMLLKQSHE